MAGASDFFLSWVIKRLTGKSDLPVFFVFEVSQVSRLRVIICGSA